MERHQLHASLEQGFETCLFSCPEAYIDSKCELKQFKMLLSKESLAEIMPATHAQVDTEASVMVNRSPTRLVMQQMM